MVDTFFTQLGWTSTPAPEKAGFARGSAIADTPPSACLV
jgi:hypothetical protein